MHQPDAGTPHEAAPKTHEEVLARYKELRAEHQARHAALLAQQRRLFLLLGGVVLLILAETAASTLHHGLPAWPLLLSFAAVAVVIGLLMRLQPRLTRAQRLVDFYDACLQRADGTRPYSDRTGTEAAEPFTPNHLYLHDLDITGPQSLFSILSTVRTGIGERGLARFLLAPVPHQESLERQQAVRELAPQTTLREHIALLGASSFQQISATFFDQWLDDPPPTFQPVFRYALAVTAAISAVLLLLGIFRVRTWSDLLPNLAAALAIQAGLSLAMRNRATPLLDSAAKLQAQVRLFSEGLALLERSSFNSEKLRELQRLSREPAGAVTLLSRLDSHLLIVEQRKRGFFLIVSLLFAAGSQTAISIANWKRRNAASMRLWLTAWAEFEALNALATYAFEHPADNANYTWPELLPPTAAPQFAAQTLGHPLLTHAVPNHVALDANTRFFLISGSNMAGKSTLMRSMGVAAVLAYAGAPVRAASLRLSPLTVGASIALTDSLAEGKSKFLAEVERLAAIVSASQTTPVLFLVDEIFSGTNSLDRRTAASAVLSRLLAHGAIGALSTHDLALTSLATDENHGTNVHMASPDPADPLAFDYILKPGINEHSNALAIIRMIGLST